MTLHFLHILAAHAHHHHDLRPLLAHELWLIHHGYAHRALLELRQIVWAIHHGYPHG